LRAHAKGCVEIFCTNQSEIDKIIHRVASSAISDKSLKGLGRPNVTAVKAVASKFMVSRGAFGYAVSAFPA
jgi:hypothetical protein